MLMMTHNGFRIVRFFTLIAMTASLCFSPSIVNSEESRTFTAFIETFAAGRIDWESGVIYGTGRAYLDQNARSRPMTLRAAQLVAVSNILKLAAGVNLDDRRKLGEFGDGNFVVNLKAFLRFSEHDTRLVDNTARPYYEVTRKTRLSGISGLNLQILKQMKASGDPLPLPQQPARPIEERADAPWLVLDARDLPSSAKVQPALFPRIASTSGQTVYDLGAVNPAALEKRPMASYVESVEDVRRLQSLGIPANRLAGLAALLFDTRSAVDGEDKPRKKRRRFIVKKAQGLQGLARTNLVISAHDARALQAEDSASRILQNCRVIVIVSSPVGGVEGQLPRYLPAG